MTLHLLYSFWLEGVAGAVLITYSIDNYKSNDLSRSRLLRCQAGTTFKEGDEDEAEPT